MVIDTIIKKGYKQAELGVIPEDWEVKKMGNVCSVYSGGTPSTSTHSYYGGDIPWITSSDLNSGIIYSVNGRITKKGLDCSSAKMVKPDSLLLALYGATAGVVGFTKIEAAINQAVLALLPKQDNSIYLYHYFIYKKDWLIKTYTQGGQPNLSGEIIKSINLPIPPTKSEQTAIATVLSDTDALIERLGKLIAKKKAIKQGAMQQLLTGKKRLSGFSVEWDVRKLGEIFSLTATYSKSNFIDSGGNYLIMDMGSVSSVGQMIASKRTFLSVDPLRIGDLVMPKDDIGGGNIIGKVAYIDQDNKYVLGDHVYKLTAINSKTDTLFFSYLINSNIINSELKKKVSGTAQLGLGRKSVEEQDVKIPKDKEEQNASKA